MKRFVIPAFFVIDAEAKKAAEALAGEMQTAARQALPIQRQGAALLFQDEELPTVEIPINDDDEAPHSYVCAVRVGTLADDDAGVECPGGGLGEIRRLPRL